MWLSLIGEIQKVGGIPKVGGSYWHIPQFTNQYQLQIISYLENDRNLKSYIVNYGMGRAKSGWVQFLYNTIQCECLLCPMYRQHHSTESFQYNQVTNVIDQYIFRHTMTKHWCYNVGSSYKPSNMSYVFRMFAISRLSLHWRDSQLLTSVFLQIYKIKHPAFVSLANKFLWVTQNECHNCEM